MEMEPSAENKPKIKNMPRRAFLKLGRAAIGAALLSAVDTSGIALACPRNGNPTEGTCFGTWYGKLLMHRFHFLDMHRDGKLQVFRAGDIPLSPVENGGNIEVEFWGFGQRHQVFRLHAPEWGNGLGINVTPEAFNPGNPIWKDPGFLKSRPTGIEYVFNGGVDIWKWDENPITHEKRRIAKENFKYRRMLDDWSGPVPIPGTNKFYEWEVCLELCTDPDSLTPADYIIGTGWPSVEAFLAAKGPKGLRDRRNEMAKPIGNPQESFLY
ncbi:hypothetical protein HYW46_05430 [Candidatus Daviesbacteria bacterium]|nr:hypothetical protein [Candidatus Daviesbacteria bacterium]